MGIEQDQQHMLEAIQRLTDARFRAHMMSALESFDVTVEAAAGNATTEPNQSESDRRDPLTTALRSHGTTIKSSRDALLLAVHLLLQELGFAATTASTASGLPLPEGWDTNSEAGSFTLKYKHSNDTSMVFTLQALFVGNKFEIYISDNRNHTHNLELSIDQHVIPIAPTTTPVLAADCLQNLELLRRQFVAFAEPIVPNKPVSTTASGLRDPPRRLPPGAGDPYSATGDPYQIPPVGRGDVFPPAFGGGDPGMLVGPDHPLFGRRHDPSQGPVPGARFDPFGPVIDPTGPSGFGRVPPRAPAPTLPFGVPNPDHLRMPHDDSTFEGVGRPGRNGRGGGSSGFFSQPFGSDHAFY